MSIEFLKIIENIEEKSEADIVRTDSDTEKTDNIRFDIDLIEAEFESFLGKDNLKCVAETRRYYAFPCDFTNKALIKDVIHNKKKFSSSFYDKEDAKQQIIKALRNHLSDISEWKKRNSSAHNYYEKTLTIKEQARDEKKSLTGIGWGITNKFEIYNTASFIIILERNNDSDIGFIIKRAYPVEYNDEAYIVDRIGQKELREGSVRTFGLTKIEKTYMAAKIMCPQCVHYFNNTDNCVSLSFYNQIHVRLFKNKTEVTIANESGRKDIKLKDVKKLWPGVYKTVRKLKKIAG